MTGTFSESWYRVAKVRTMLRPTVIIKKNVLRGENGYIISDPYSGAYFRISPAYYRFLSGLTFQETVEERWLKSLTEDPENGPGQQDIINLLVELNNANLIYFEDTKDSEGLFKKNREKTKKAIGRQLTNILFVRIPLWNPDRWLNKHIGIWTAVYSRIGLFIWMAVTFYGLKLGAENSLGFMSQTENILDPDNLVLLYAGVLLLKIFHEIGHAAACVRYGGEVNTIGVMFLLFTPLPYVDATSSWVLTDKWQRILVSSAGMMVEVFIGCLACSVWVYSPPGLAHALAFNIMFTATVSTVLFNANPLTRYDGYYILSDLLEIPNFSQKSTEYTLYLLKKHLFKANCPVKVYSRAEQIYFVSYAAASSVYRIALFIGIIYFVSKKYFMVGLIMAVVMAGMWLYRILSASLDYLLFSPELKGVRNRAVYLTSGITAVILVFIFFIPLPYSLTVAGVAESRQAMDLTAETSGYMVRYNAESGKYVRKGQILAETKNPLLDMEIRKVMKQIEETEILAQQSITEGSIDLSPVNKRTDALYKYLDQLKYRKSRLIISAPQSGIWIWDRDNGGKTGQWMGVGHPVGTVYKEGSIFKCIVPQEEASDIFELGIKRLKIRMKGNAWTTYRADRYELLPHALNTLPSPALGWYGGGEIRTDETDRSGTKTIEPFYLLTVYPDESEGMYGGCTGKAEITLPPKTLSYRITQGIRQFFQKRYRL